MMIHKLLLPLLLTLTASLFAQLERDSIHVIQDDSRHISYQLVDADADGDVDIIANQKGYNGNFILYQNIDGSGAYASGEAFGERTWEGLPDVKTNFSLGDMDNDGDLDLVSGNIVNATKPYRENIGNGQFAFIPDLYDYYDSQNDYHRQQLEDLNNDGWLDVVLFKTGSFGLSINKNNGTNNDFELLPFIDLDESFSNNFRSWMLFDFDQDGDKDIVYVVESLFSDEEKKLQMVLLEQTCEFCFSEYSRLDIDNVAGFFSRVKVEAQQLNEDEFPDIVLYYEAIDVPALGNDDTRDYLVLLKNENGSGTFTPALLEEDFSDFAAGDIDHDGDIDLVVVYDSDMMGSSGADENYYSWTNEGNFEFTQTLIDEIPSGTSLQLSDINSDGELDLISFNDSGYFFVRWGEPLSNFSAVQSLNITSERLSAFEPADWDGDGDLDVVSIGKTNVDGSSFTGIFLSKNLGDGQFDSLELLRSIDEVFYYGKKDLADLNGDDLPDVISIGLFNTDDGQQQLLNCYLSQMDGDIQEGIDVTIGISTRISDFELGDFDLDGDIDILSIDGENSQVLMSWNNLQEDGTFLTEPINLSNQISYSDDLIVSDINGDEYPDIIIRINNDYWWATKLPEGNMFTELRALNFIGVLSASTMQIHKDFDADPEAELLFRGSVGTGVVHLLRSDYEVDTDSFSTPRIVRYGRNNITSQIIPIDLNEDGLLDIMNYRGFSLNIPGSDFFTSPYIPSPFSSTEERFPFFANATLADLDGDLEKEILANSGSSDLIYYNKQFLEGKTLQGNIRWDQSAECLYSDTLAGISGWNIALSHEEGEQLIHSNIDGHYGAFLPFNGDYRVAPIPPSGYWEVCPVDSVLTINPDSEHPDSVNFSAQALVDCPLVVINMSSTNISQCFGSSMSVSYYNAGTANAYEASIHISFDERLTPVYSSIPWQNQTDSTLIFNFDQIDIGQRGFININFEPDCSALILGEELCFEATITPNDLCEDMLLNWSGANLEASSFCEDNQTAFRIVNTGENAMDMTEQVNISIVNDDIILYLSDDVILDPGEADTIWLPAIDDGIWHLAINQPQGHPFPEPISLLTTSCSTSGPTPPLVPNGDGDPFRETLCHTVTGPYDPNDKTARPSGLGLSNEIEKDWELTYTIRFQNTGNDRARTVVLHDPLSEWLALSSFKAIGASHDYEWVITDDRNLVITFPNINLPDSTHNEVASHGFFSFSIKPKADIPVETVINNFADIYFDLNPPIRTATVFHKIRKPVHSAALHIDLCAGEMYNNMEIWQDTILQETMSFMDYDSITFYHLTILEIPQIIEEVTFQEPLTWEGLFIENDTMIERTYIAMNGCDSLVTYQFSLINGINELNQRELYTLAPNPAKDFTILTMNQEHVEPILLELYTSDGRFIKNITPVMMQDGGMRIDLSGLASGVVVLRIEVGTRPTTSSRRTSATKISIPVVILSPFE